MEMKTDCARCPKVVCNSEHFMEGPSNCPTKTRTEIMEQAMVEYGKTDVGQFARQASIQEFECYLNLPEGRTPRNPRVEEVIQFAKKMGYRKLGIAFCGGLQEEARILHKILRNRGFDIVSISCKAGAVPKERIGIAAEQKIEGPDAFEAMCSPIAQAKVLNSEGAEFNILVGLCVGHDSLFFKYAEAPTTVLIAKDRVFGHNPAAGLYLSGSYYRELLRQEPLGY